MLGCVICKIATPTDGILIDGSVYHRSCYDRLQNRLQALLNTERTLLAELRKPLSFGKNILMFFFTAKQQQMLNEKQSLSWRLQAAREEIITLRTILRAVYDVWPTYPPDWDERRDNIGNRDQHSCAECGVGDRLHLHHRRPLHEGGSNRLDNLVLLCSYCHSQAHGGVEFKERWKAPAPDQITSLGQKIARIQEALAKHKELHFHYKKPDGAITRRTVGNTARIA